MKRIIPVIALFALPLLLAADKPWPQKGDTVYVSVTLPAVSQPMFFGAKPPDHKAIDQCAPLTARKISEDLIVLRDDSGVDRRLEGAWGTRLHASEKACRAAVTAAPAVRAEVERHKVRYGIVGYVLVEDSPGH